MLLPFGGLNLNVPQLNNVNECRRTVHLTTQQTLTICQSGQMWTGRVGSRRIATENVLRNYGDTTAPDSSRTAQR